MAPLNYALRAIGRRYRVLIPAAVGLGAVVVSIAPAFAHTANISGSVACSNGTQVITWQVGNSQTGKGQDMNIQSATSSQGTVSGLPAAVAPGAKVNGITSLPASASGSVTLTVKAFWPYDRFSTTVTSSGVKLSNACVVVTTTTTVPNTTTTTVPNTTTTTIPDTTTTTAIPDTTTTTVPVTTSTDPSTTTTSVPGQTTTTVAASVLGESFTKPPSSAAPLAFTGTAIGRVFMVGLALALMGTVVMGHRSRGLLRNDH